MGDLTMFIPSKAAGRIASRKTLSAEVLKSLRADVQRSGRAKSVEASVIPCLRLLSCNQCDRDAAKQPNSRVVKESPLLQEPVAAGHSPTVFMWIRKKPTGLVYRFWRRHVRRGYHQIRGRDNPRAHQRRRQFPRRIKHDWAMVEKLICARA